MAGVRADLLSDTLTRPTDAMRAAMARAEVGDDVFGEDPTLRALEERVADLLGHEAALFTPSGSMANQLGVRLHVHPGEELVSDALAHVVRAELGAAAVLSGITSRTWDADRGRFRAADAAARMVTGVGPYQVCTALVVVENTHNFGGGTVQSLDEIRAARALTTKRGVAMHLDGARLWNAHVATGTPLRAYGEVADVLAVCLSKGLGAPIGSLAVGTAEAMAEARVWRKRLGGGMRQVGVLAAAGIHALDHHLERMADDHEHAKLLAEACGVDPAGVDTNIVVVPHPDPARVVAAAREEGVLVSAVGATSLRLVTHLDVDRAAVDRAAAILPPLLA